MFTPTQFCNVFGMDYYPTLYFNQYKTIIEVIDKHLADFDYYSVIVESEDKDCTVFRCNISFYVDCTIEKLLKSIANEYREKGWRVDCSPSGEFRFQTFIKVEMSTGNLEVVDI